MLQWLQLGRCLAALAVVLHHAAIAIHTIVAPLPEGLRAVLDLGYLGVDFFFVLSGFIIHHSLHSAPRSAGRFALDRLSRILLPYLPVGVTLGCAYTLWPDLSQGARDWSWLPTLTLLPSPHPPALNLAWSLQHELMFYLLYAVLFYTRQIKMGLVIWALLIFAAQLSNPSETPLLRVFLAPINIEFIAGIAAAALYQRGRPLSLTLAAGLTTICLAGFLLGGAERTESWLIGLGLACLLPNLCHYERQRARHLPQLLLLGGSASYAVYLVHNPLLSLGARAFHANESGWLLALVISVPACFCAGLAYHLLWEVPLMRRINPARRVAK